MLRLTLVRHGATAWNENGRFQGWADVPLSERGREQADRLRARLAGVSWDRVIASDLGRAMETARRIAPDRPLETDARLRELHFGAWDGLTWDACVARDGDLVRRWVDDPDAVPPPEGETAAVFAARVGAALDALPAEGSALVVAHAGTIHAALARWLEVPLRRTFALKLSPCGVTRVQVHEGGARILCVNEGGEA